MHTYIYKYTNGFYHILQFLYFWASCFRPLTFGIIRIGCSSAQLQDSQLSPLECKPWLTSLRHLCTSSHVPYKCHHFVQGISKHVLQGTQSLLWLSWLAGSHHPTGVSRAFWGHVTARCLRFHSLVVWRGLHHFPGTVDLWVHPLCWLVGFWILQQRGRDGG